MKKNKINNKKRLPNQATKLQYVNLVELGLWKAQCLQKGFLSQTILSESISSLFYLKHSELQQTQRYRDPWKIHWGHTTDAADEGSDSRVETQMTGIQNLKLH